MTTTMVLEACRHLGIILTAAPDQLCVESPADALTPAFRAELRQHKQALIAVLTRLDGMRQNRLGPLPVALADAKGGPGRCFSCGQSIAPGQYGRCDPCDVAKELFYSECRKATEPSQTRVAPNRGARHGA